MSVTLIRGDARSLGLADASVDLIVTSPPYFALRSYTDGGQHYAGQVGSEATPSEFVAALIECTREWMRVLKPAGSIWVNLGDKYAGAPSGPRTPMSDGFTRDSWAGTFTERRRVASPVATKSLYGLPWRYALACIDELGLILRAEVIWDKPNGLPESVTDRVRRSHEQWFHFVKQPRYFAAVDEIREPHAEPKGRPGYGRERPPAPGGNRGTHVGRMDHAAHRDMGQNALGKLPGSVWTVASQPLTVPKELGVDHFAAFPMEWPRRLILGWSPPGGVVLDPFGGTGTTALVADVLGRRGISNDMSADYCRLAAWRTTDPKQRERAARPAKTKIKPEPPTPQTAAEWLIHFGL